MLKLKASFLLLFLLITLPSSGLADSPPKQLTLGIVPQHDVSKLIHLWQPIRQYLQENTPYRIELHSAQDIQSFERKLAQGVYDIAYMNPYHYIFFNEIQSYKAIIKEQERFLQGILVVNKNANINDIQDLQQQTLVFPAPAAFAASIITRDFLRQNGIHFTSRYLGNHDAVYRHIAVGDYPAGGGVQASFDKSADTVRQPLQVLWRSQQYPPHAMAVHGRVSSRTATYLQRLFLDMNQDDALQKAFAKTHFNGFTAAQDKDWDAVRALNLTDLEHLRPSPSTPK